MKILIIEDDTTVSRALRRGLKSTHLVTVAETGANGLHEAEAGRYEAIVLDLSLSDMSGLAVCQRLRASRIMTPILVLSGRASQKSKIELLDAGADDYLTKPFSLEELKARLRVIARRDSDTVRSSKLVVGPLCLNLATREATRSGRILQLRRKEFDLLECLMRHAGSVVTREALIEQVWNAREGLWTNAVDVQIKYLRDKVDRPFPTPLITTVHGVGYKLEVAP